MTEDFRLVVCDAAGRPTEPVDAMPEVLRQHCEASAALYARVGHVPPWVAYVALCGVSAVGGGAFLGPPRDGRVEIAYFTLDAFARRGFAARTAQALCEIARRAPQRPVVVAKTLAGPNPSTRILQRLGFRHVGDTVDHEVGTAWLWERR